MNLRLLRPALRLFIIAAILFTAHANALYAMWYENQTVYQIYSVWDDGNGGANGVTFIRLSGGPVCHITSQDEHFLGLVMMMKAQGLRGQFICDRNTQLGIDGMTSYRLHRVRF